MNSAEIIVRTRTELKLLDQSLANNVPTKMSVVHAQQLLQLAARLEAAVWIDFDATQST